MKIGSRGGVWNTETMCYHIWDNISDIAGMMSFFVHPNSIWQLIASVGARVRVKTMCCTAIFPYRPGEVLS